MSEERKDESGLPPLHRVQPAPDATPYELEPEPAPPPAPAGEPTVADAPAKGKLGDRSFIDEFPEDADLESDPEVERVLKGESPKGTKDSSVDDEEPAPKAGVFVKSGGDPQVFGLVGLGIAIAAAVIAGMRNADHWFYSGLLAFYMVAVHTVTGVAAAAVVAYFERARFGKVEHAAARMVVAVALGYLVISAGAGGYNVITAPLGVVMYIGALAVLFRWSPARLVRVGAVHAVIIAAQYFAMMLYAAATGA